MANTGPIVTGDIAVIARAINSALRQHRGPGALIVAVSGGAASGKSYLTKALQAIFSQKLGDEAVALLKLDYFLGRGLGLEPGADWEGYNWKDFVAAVSAVRLGRGVRVPIVEWESRRFVDVQQFPANLRVLLIDGVGIFQDGLDRYYHLGFWVRCPEGERLRRGIARSYATPHPDGGTYGPIHEQMWPTWVGKDRRYIEKHRPEHRPVVVGIFSNGAQLPEELLKPM